jgi:hypothetical protein
MKHLLLLVALGTAACVQKPAPPEVRSRQDDRVSIVQVLANPDEFDGKAVRLFGYLQLEFETYALWLHREDRVHALLPNRIDLEASACADEVEQVNERYALLEGTFVILNKGTAQKRHLLQNITRCQFWAEAK